MGRMKDLWIEMQEQMYNESLSNGIDYGELEARVLAQQWQEEEMMAESGFWDPEANKSQRRYDSPGKKDMGHRQEAKVGIGMGELPGGFMRPMGCFPDEKCSHDWETKHLLISSYKKCTKCGEEEDV